LSIIYSVFDTINTVIHKTQPTAAFIVAGILLYTKVREGSKLAFLDFRNNILKGSIKIKHTVDPDTVAHKKCVCIPSKENVLGLELSIENKTRNIKNITKYGIYTKNGDPLFTQELYKYLEPEKSEIIFDSIVCDKYFNSYIKENKFISLDNLYYEAWTGKNRFLRKKIKKSESRELKRHIISFNKNLMVY